MVRFKVYKGVNAKSLDYYLDILKHLEGWDKEGYNYNDILRLVESEE